MAGEGATEVDRLSAGGFSEAEIQEYVQTQRSALTEGGFTPTEIDEYFGTPPINEEPMWDFAKETFDTVMDEIAGPDDETGERPGVMELVERGVKQGYQSSVTGLIQSGELPEPAEVDVPFMESISRQLGTLGGDLPVMVPSALATAPAGPVVSMGAAFGMPAGLRKALMDAYSKGEVLDVEDWFARQAAIFLATAKGSLTGASTALTGGAATTLPGKIGAEITTMVTVGHGLEGEVPSVQNFAEAAVLILGFRGATKVVGEGATTAQKTVVKTQEVLQDIYARTGRHPTDVLKDMQTDPTILQDVIGALNPNGRQVPRAYERITEVAEETTVAVSESPKAPPAPPGVEAASQAVGAKISVGASEVRNQWTLDRIYTEAVDSLYPLQGLVQTLAKGEKLDANVNPYIEGRFVPAASARAQLFLDFEVRKFGSTEVVSKGLKQVLDPVKNDLQNFREYAASRRTLELAAREIEPGIPVEAARALVDAGKGKYAKVFDELQDYQNALLDYLSDSGVVSKEMVGKMREANKDYLPFFRLFDEQTGGGLNGSVRNPIKAIKGSERNVIDPIESIIKNTYLYVQLAQRNQVGVKLVELAERVSETASEGALVKRVKPTVKPIKVAPEEMTQIAKDAKAEFGIEFTPAELVVFRANALNPGPTEIAVFRNGKREIYEVGADVAEAMNGMDAQSANMFVKILSVPASTLRAGAILNPSFFVKNLMRDTVSATVFSTGGFRPFVDTLSGLGTLLNRKNSQVYRDWLASGGANATFISLDRRYLQESLQKLTQDTAMMQVKNLVTSPLEILRIGAELSENATRIGLFKRKTRGRRDPKSQAEGGFESREGTLDFAKMGASIRGWNGVSAFLSARVNGYDRAVRAFKDNPVRATALATATITLPSIGLWIKNHDDPVYKRLPQWQKDLFWIVIVDGETNADGSRNPTVYRIPKPFELGVIFGSVPEHILDAYIDANPDAMGDIINAFGSDTLSSLIPNMLSPVMEQISNYSVYRDAPLIPNRFEGMVPDMQYTDYTTETAKALGRATSFVSESMGANPADAGISPIVIENYVRQWTGGLGFNVLKLVDKGLRETGVVPDPPKVEDTLSDIPFVKSFVIRYPSAGAQPIADFHDRYNQVKKIQNSVEQLYEEGEFERAEEIISLDPAAEYDLDATRAMIAEQTSYIRRLVKIPDEDIPPAEKRQLIDETYMIMIEAAEMQLEIMADVGE